jgi:hypothetical protein
MVAAEIWNSHSSESTYGVNRYTSKEHNRDQRTDLAETGPTSTFDFHSSTESNRF